MKKKILMLLILSIIAYSTNFCDKNGQDSITEYHYPYTALDNGSHNSFYANLIFHYNSSDIPNGIYQYKQYILIQPYKELKKHSTPANDVKAKVTIREGSVNGKIIDYTITDFEYYYIIYPHTPFQSDVIYVVILEYGAIDGSSYKEVPIFWF